MNKTKLYLVTAGDDMIGIMANTSKFLRWLVERYIAQDAE